MKENDPNLYSEKNRCKTKIIKAFMIKATFDKCRNEFLSLI